MKKIYTILVLFISPFVMAEEATSFWFYTGLNGEIRSPQVDVPKVLKDRFGDKLVKHKIRKFSGIGTGDVENQRHALIYKDKKKFLNKKLKLKASSSNSDAGYFIGSYESDTKVPVTCIKNHDGIQFYNKKMIEHAFLLYSRRLHKFIIYSDNVEKDTFCDYLVDSRKVKIDWEKFAKVFKTKTIDFDAIYKEKESLIKMEQEIEVGVYGSGANELKLYYVPHLEKSGDTSFFLYTSNTNLGILFNAFPDEYRPMLLGDLYIYAYDDLNGDGYLDMALSTENTGSDDFGFILSNSKGEYIYYKIDETELYENYIGKHFEISETGEVKVLDNK